MEKVQTELTVFRDLLENKDDQIVKLTNQIHEIELKNVMHGSVPPSPGGPRTPHLSNLSLHKLNAGRASSNGISFDSDKGEFKEFIDVGSQTSQRSSMVSFKVEKILKGSLHLIPSPSVKIQIMGGRVSLWFKGKTKFVDITQQCFALLPQVNLPDNNLNFH